jgi:hypothetical protein
MEVDEPGDTSGGWGRACRRRSCSRGGRGRLGTDDAGRASGNQPGEGESSHEAGHGKLPGRVVAPLMHEIQPCLHCTMVSPWPSLPPALGARTTAAVSGLAPTPKDDRPSAADAVYSRHFVLA